MKIKTGIKGRGFRGLRKYEAMEIKEDIYAYYDLSVLQDMQAPQYTHATGMRSLEELLEREKQREKDGFPRKIRIGRLMKPGKSDKGKIVVVPTTVEEKFIHDHSIQAPDQEGASGGSGEGEEGDIIGEEPIRNGTPSGAGPGEGEGGEHEIESSAYDLGKILTEKFELPNLKDKGKKALPDPVYL